MIPSTRIRAMALALAIVIAPAIAAAQSGGAYDLSWNSLDAGGGTSTGSTYRLFGTAGQPDAGRHTGGSYVLTGGFLPHAATTIGIPDPGAPGAPPAVFQLLPITPNPFATRTAIAFDLPRAAPVSLAIYSPNGKLVRRLVDEERPAGRHRVEWAGTDPAGRRLARGVYLIRLQALAETATRKVVLTH